MNLDLQLKRGASFLTCEIIDLRTDHRLETYATIYCVPLERGGVDLLPFYRHIAPLERKTGWGTQPLRMQPPVFPALPVRRRDTIR